MLTRCLACHGQDGTQGLDLTTYVSALAGGAGGPAIVPGNAAASLLVEKQSGSQPHYSQLTADELEIMVTWIGAGAPEN